MRAAAFLLLPVALVACGDAESADVGFRESVAQRFDADCRGAEAPTAKARRELQFLCSCAGRRIRSSDITFRDGQDQVSDKVRRVTEVCTRELYGDTPEAGNEIG